MSTRPYTSVWNDLREVEFSQGFLQAGPYRTRYLHAGDPSKPTLLMLHGITGHAEAYVRNLAAHAEHFSCWAIDFIGHGYSSKPDHPLEVHHYVEQVNHVLDTLGVEKAYFTGESLGGWTTARYAIDHPDRVERIVLNTMGGTMANPKVMERLYTLSMEAARDPSWERVKARLEWLMADPAMVTDDLIRTRQAIFEQPDWLQGVRDEHGAAGPGDPSAQHAHRRPAGPYSGPRAGAVDDQGPVRAGGRGQADRLADPQRAAGGDGQLRALAPVRGPRHLQQDPPRLPPRPRRPDAGW